MSICEYWPVPSVKHWLKIVKCKCFLRCLMLSSEWPHIIENIVLEHICRNTERGFACDLVNGHSPVRGGDEFL